MTVGVRDPLCSKPIKVWRLEFRIRVQTARITIPLVVRVDDENVRSPRHATVAPASVAAGDAADDRTSDSKRRQKQASLA